MTPPTISIWQVGIGDSKINTSFNERIFWYTYRDRLSSLGELWCCEEEVEPGRNINHYWLLLAWLMSSVLVWPDHPSLTSPVHGFVALDSTLSDFLLYCCNNYYDHWRAPPSKKCNYGFWWDVLLQLVNCKWTFFWWGRAACLLKGYYSRKKNFWWPMSMFKYYKGPWIHKLSRNCVL